jgi:hypothetical protein
MASTRGKDRRQINVKTPLDKRGTGTERRRCPDCGSSLQSSTKTVAGGSVITLSCTRCDWTHSSRTTDADVLMTRMSWALPLEKKGGGLQVAFPSELAEALKLKAGDSLLLRPLTLPVGSLPMRWALSLERKTTKKK